MLIDRRLLPRAGGTRRGGGVAGARLAGALAVAGERALDGGGEEAREQRVRAVRPRAELRVELRADHPGVVADLADLDERAVRGRAARDESGLSTGLALDSPEEGRHGLDAVGG